MVKREAVEARLERLREYLTILRTVQGADIQQYLRDPILHGAAERYLHLSVECLLDIGNHVIADRGLRKPSSYGEILSILRDENVIPEPLAQELAGMASFRNILVHDYLRLDRERVYRVIQEQLVSLEELARIYAEMV